MRYEALLLALCITTASQCAEEDFSTDEMSSSEEVISKCMNIQDEYARFSERSESQPKYTAITHSIWRKMLGLYVTLSNISKQGETLPREAKDYANRYVHQFERNTQGLSYMLPVDYILKLITELKSYLSDNSKAEGRAEVKRAFNQVHG